MTVAVQPVRRRGALLVTLVERDMRLRAKRSFTGLVWPLVAPFLLLGLYSFVFGRVFDVPVHDYPIFLFAGLLPWTFLAQSLHASVQTISSEPELIHRAPFPYELLPLATVRSMAAYFLGSLAIFGIWLAAAGRLHVLVTPVLLAPVASLVLVTGSLAMLIALLDVYSRDLRLVLGNLLTVWFFLVPIVYAQRMTPGVLHPLRSIDPMNVLVGQFRSILYDGEISQPTHFVFVFLGAAALFAGCLLLFRRLATRLPKDV